jgi:hypothetical protein
MPSKPHRSSQGSSLLCLHIQGNVCGGTIGLIIGMHQFLALYYYARIINCRLENTTEIHGALRRSSGKEITHFIEAN